MSAPPLGRGGRGAALRYSMMNPSLKPGDSRSDNSESQPQVKNGPSIGRGAMLLNLKSQTSTGKVDVMQNITNGMQSASLSTKDSNTPASSITSSPIKPMGRGAMMRQLLASQSSKRSHVPEAGLSNEQSADQDHRLAINQQRHERSQAEHPNYSTPAVVHRGKHGIEIPLSVNYIRLKCKNKGVFQYVVSYSPEVDSINMRYKLLFNIPDIDWKVRSFDGTMLFLPFALPEKEVQRRCVRPTDGAEVIVKIKLIKVVPPSACAQLYNVIFRNIMRILKMVPVHRHFFDPREPVPVPQHKLEIWPGFITSIKEYEGGLMLLADVRHKALRTETVHDILYELSVNGEADFKSAVAKRILGETILTRYNNQTYRIDDIAWDMNPKSTFTLSSGETISYKDYYRRQYSKLISDDCQPLLISKRKKSSKKDGDKSEAQGLIALVPELCYMTGLKMISDFKVLKDIAQHTRVTPQQRNVCLRRFCQRIADSPQARAELDKWGLEMDMEPITVTGRRLQKEKVLMHSVREEVNESADFTRLVTSNQCISGVNLEDWVIIYVGMDEVRTKSFVRTLQRIGPQLGMRIKPPVLRKIPNDRTESYVKELRAVINPQLQLVVTVFPSSRDDRYNAVKKLCCSEMPVPSQVIISRTLHERKLTSVTQKIALQVNCKMGGELWSVDIPGRGLMVCGIDTYHDKPRAEGSNQSIGGFVASLNQRCTKWFSAVCFQRPGEELINGLVLCMTRALKKYYEDNHELPARIILYRDGVGDGDLSNVTGHELQQLTACFSGFPNYHPKFAAIIVQKRINQRIFRRKDNGCFENPAHGTVLDHTITRKELYDFFLVSQYVRQGSVSPTHYIVVHDDSGWDEDKIQRLTYKLTHMYYNWPGTIRVPAPCQYAHKLASLVGNNTHKEPSQRLCNRLFFL